MTCLEPIENASRVTRTARSEASCIPSGTARSRLHKDDRMSATTDRVECVCGAVLSESAQQSAQARVPCAKCGSLSRKFFVEVESTLHLYSSLP